MPAEITSIEAVLRDAEAGIRTECRAVVRAGRRRAAELHQRSDLYLYVESAVAHAVMARPDDPAATWAALRQLCRHLRFNRSSIFGSGARYNGVEMVAAGEARVLHRQWARRRGQERARALMEAGSFLTVPMMRLV